MTIALTRCLLKVFIETVFVFLSVRLMMVVRMTATVMVFSNLYTQIKNQIKGNTSFVISLPGWDTRAKESGFGADLVRKYEDSKTKIYLPQVINLARPVLRLVSFGSFCLGSTLEGISFYISWNLDLVASGYLWCEVCSTYDLLPL
ncbi:transmembrane protein, putative [Medicago truncatula]|uniref:Transmembrane protein, putative n=1 Tax=Medicago truncatula TaxID=3880 RepID=G7KGX2_MEDTR|nr:transmembrane protein, putative [Medicago truncatula]